MQGCGRTDELGNLISAWGISKIVEEPLATTRQDRRVRQMHLVDQSGPQILLNRGGAACQPDIAVKGDAEVVDAKL